MRINIPVSAIEKLLLLLGLAFLVAITWYATWYITTGYNTVANWFTGLGNCFYRSTYWRAGFFTEQVKQAGNRWCAVALAFAIPSAILLLWYTAKTLKTKRPGIPVRLEPVDLLQAGIVLSLAISLWFWGTGIAKLSNDEAFSALNCASLHPFQTASYYMLPNNHVLFNLLNNVLFHYADKTVSGRVLSLLIYCTLLLTLLAFLRRLMGNKWLALSGVLVMATQFPIWGFGCQGRGYELMAFSEWLLLISYLSYTKTNARRWLYTIAAACCIGYFTIPIFMYFHMALLLFAALQQLSSRQINKHFWLSQLAAGIAVFLLYLPCLSFSGLQAITGNPWLTITQEYSQLLHDLVDTCHEFMDYTYCNVGRGNYYPDLVLFLLPLTLFCYRSNMAARRLATFYCCMWGVLVLFTLKMKLFPMDRALPGQFSVTLALTLYALYLGLDKLMNRHRVIKAVIFSVCLLLMGANYLDRDRQHITHYQCHFPVNNWHQVLTEGIHQYLPAGSTVGCSDESFYWRYLCGQYGYKTNRCATGAEQYFIKYRQEPWPENIHENDYVVIADVADYNIFRKKQ